MMPRTASRGQPLIALLLLLCAWVGARAAMWEDPEFAPVMAAPPAFAELENDPSLPAEEDIPAFSWRDFGPLSTPSGQFMDRPAPLPQVAYTPSILRRAAMPARWAAEPRGYAMPRSPYLAGVMPYPFIGVPGPQPEMPRTSKVPVRIASAHQVLWMAALSNMPVAPELTAAREYTPSPAFYASEGSERRAKRWSGDAWMLLRRGNSGRLAAGATPTTYGASQAGGILRYRFAPQSGHRPTAYLRATAALSGLREKEAALGLSARPVPAIPLVAAAELRATDQQGGTRFRPAAMVVTEFPPAELPMGARAEFYGQAGYVGGRFKTAFADGQLRVDRQLMQLGKGELRAGGGAWAGAQKGASRVDVGPTATMGLPLGESASARVAFDWRFRVGGNAQPQSGPALTVSAGF